MDAVWDLLEVLNGSLDLHAALGGAYPILAKLVPVEHGALCISKPENPMLYDWAVAEIPDAFFRGYADIAPYDFVRAAVSQRPNVVLRETDMIASRSELERHPLYRHCRASDMPIEHVMAVMFASEPGWHGGLTLYRGDRGPFSDRERQILQFLAPYFASTVSNCKQLSDVKRRSSLLDASLSLGGIEVIVFSESMAEIARSDGVGRLLRRCLGGQPAGSGGLPAVLWAHLQEFAGGTFAVPPPPPWIPPIRGAGLVVSFKPCVIERRTHWMVMLDEAPPAWREPGPRRLTNAEIDVTVRAVQGWDNALIASELGNTETTVKKHLSNIFIKLGVGCRAALTARWRDRS